MRPENYTKQRHRYLADLWLAGGVRPRIRERREGFGLLELGLLDWVYPTPMGLLQGPEARDRFPEMWDDLRAEALERITTFGSSTLSAWTRWKKI